MLTVRFAIQMQGSVRAVGVAASGATEKREARSSKEARREAVYLCAAIADATARDYASDARAKSLMGMGPLTVMDDAELTHMQRLLSITLEARALAALGRVTAEAEVQARKAPRNPSTRSSEAAFEVVHDVVPPQDDASVRGRLERTIAAVELGDTDTARQLVDGVAADEAAWLQESAGVDSPKAAFYSRLLALAHLVDRAASSSSTEACCTFAAESLAASLSTQESSWKSFYLDTNHNELIAAAFAEASRLLGDQHVLTASLARIVAARAVRNVEEEWPDEDAVRSARIAEAQADVPIPERVWAMRNAAATLAMTGAREQAVATLTTAVELKVEWLEAEDDPRVLGELCDLHAVLDDYQRAQEVAGECVHASARIYVLDSKYLSSQPGFCASASELQMTASLPATPMAPYSYC